MTFFAELKRRNVIRMAGLYVVGAWLIVQVAETLLPLYDTPAWVLKALVLLLAIGFVPTLVFSWVFELTPDGLKRETDVDHSPGATDRTARKLDVVVIILLLAVIGMIFVQPGKSPVPSIETPMTASATGSTGIPPIAEVNAASIAVLPFADLSQAGDQAYFSEGMAEEILNVLARTKGLQVASRTSSFAFKDQQDLGIPAIARQLEVRHVLEGSVRRSGDTVRVTAQLIDAKVDRHLWSETFDRPLTAENLFAIQDEIAKAIVAALVESLGIENVGVVDHEKPTANLSAYDLYLQARALFQARRKLDLVDQLLSRALELDPRFAKAWELRAATQPLLPEYTDTKLSDEELDKRGIEYAARALALDPDSALALAAQANIRMRAARTLRAATSMKQVIDDLERSVALDPQNGNALNWLGNAVGLVGQNERALETFQRCAVVDPLNAACVENEYETLFVLGRNDEAHAHFLAALEKGLVTEGYVNFSLLAAYKQESTFLLALNGPKVLPGWRRQGEIYRAYLDPAADHQALLGALRTYLEQTRESMKGYKANLLIPLGIYDVLPPNALVYWGEDYARYRQSPEFKAYIRDSGIFTYWRNEGFPAQCRALPEDDFACD
jgi:adenylate cyclase